MNSCEDFFKLVTTAHIIVAAMKIFGMSKIDDKPDEKLFPSNTDNPAIITLKEAVKKILLSFVDLSFPVEVAKEALKINGSCTCRRKDSPLLKQFLPYLNSC